MEVLQDRPVVTVEHKLEARTVWRDQTEPGIWFRHDAGRRSLIERANLEVEVGEIGKAEECSHYGDTDRRVAIAFGDPIKSFTFPPAWGRVARFEGELVLHRTVGNRAEFRLEGVLIVKSSSSGSVTKFKLHDLDARLVERVVEEMTASSLEK